MSSKFDYVIHCTLNNSASKQNYRFAKAHRFPPTARSKYHSLPSSCMQASYDLSNTMMTSRLSSKDSVLPRTERFRTAGSLSPSPDAYMHTSFIEENKRNLRGNKVGKAKRYDRLNTTPGPGRYESDFNPETKLAYTMRAKKEPRDYGSVWVW